MDSVAINRRRMRRKVPYRDFSRAVVAGMLLILVFIVAFHNREWMPLLGGPKDASYTVGDPSDHALRTGSVVFVPRSGNRCRQRLIDNYTWFMRDNGFINCDELVYRGGETVGRDQREYNAGPRLDAIRDAFSRKK
jgi:hypothetical protein